VSEVFGEKFRNAVVRCIRPQLGIKPWQPVRRHTEQCRAKDAFVGVEHLENRP